MKKKKIKLKENEMAKKAWSSQLAQLLKQPPPGLTSQEIKRFGDEVVNALSVSDANKQLGGFRSVMRKPDRRVDAANKQLQGFRSVMSKQESKRITSSDIKEVIKEAIIIHEKKKAVTKVIKETVEGQVTSRRLINSLLTEGPLSNVWGGIKNASREFGSHVKSAAQGAVQGIGKSFEAGQEKAQQNAILSSVTKTLKDVSQARQKFAQQTFKNSEMINSYHDAVMSLAQGYMQAAQAIPGDSPELLKMADEVNQNIVQLKKDLESEKSGIDTFLKNISDKISRPEMKGADQIPDAPPARGPEIKSAPMGQKLPRRTTGAR